MSGRMADREDRAVDVVTGLLAHAGLSGRVRVAGDPTGRILEALASNGMTGLAWERGPAGTAWPDDVVADAAILRMPKGREALRMALHAVASRLHAGGRLLVYGANDEGVRSAGRTLEEAACEVRTLETRRHCRVWTGQVDAPEALRGGLDDWAVPCAGGTARGPIEWVSFPGLFAHGHLDPATALLLADLPEPGPQTRVLDYGCGAGVIGAALARTRPDLAMHAIDPDPLALEATRRNVPGVVTTAGTGLAALPAEARFDWIVSNPPIHSGREQHHDVVRNLCEGAPGRLRGHGRIWLVAQRTVPVGRWLESGFERVEAHPASRSFTVWSGRRPRPGKARRAGAWP